MVSDLMSGGRGEGEGEGGGGRGEGEREGEGSKHFWRTLNTWSYPDICSEGPPTSVWTSSSEFSVNSFTFSEGTLHQRAGMVQHCRSVVHTLPHTWYN